MKNIQIYLSAGIPAVTFWAAIIPCRIKSKLMSAPENLLVSRQLMFITSALL